MAFPVSADGRRSTSALGRAVVADALRRVDAAGAGAAERETGWRTGYLAHFRGLIEAGLGSRQAAVSVARDGLASLHRRMRVIGRDGEEAGLDALVSAPARGGLAAATVTGTGEAERELSVPYRGERLSGDALAAPARGVGERRRHRTVVRGRRAGGRGAARTGCPCPAGRSWCSARVPRWARCRCC